MTSSSSPSLSVILPTYNGVRFLRGQLDSIIGQSFQNFELILADDGSIDRTPDLLAEYAARDARIRLLPTSGNIGQRQRLWELTLAASANLIAMSDQDDVWHPNKLARLIEVIGDADAAFGRSQLIDAEGLSLGRTILDNLPPIPEPGDRLLYLFKPSMSAHAAILRRCILTEGSFQRTWPFDWLHSLDAAFGNGICYVDNAVTYHRMHDANQVNGSHAIERGGAKPLKLTSIWQHFAETHWRRDIFMQNIGYLAHSPLMPPDRQRLFAKVHGRCHYHWYERPAPVRIADPGLFAFIMDEIGPLAGSQHDLANARRFLFLLTSGPLHYRRALRFFGRTELAAVPY